MAEQENITLETHRVFNTRKGNVAVSREQKGIPLAEFFQNNELPKDIHRAVIYQTDKGPVIAKPDIVQWNEQHNKRTEKYADSIKTLIDTKGYYSRPLNNFADKLAEETGKTQQEVKGYITQVFKTRHGSSPQSYLERLRLEKGLPVRDRNVQAPTQDRF